MRNTCCCALLICVGALSCTGNDEGTKTTTTDGAVVVDCSGGALEFPVPGCRPKLGTLSDDPAADCVERINQFRWECQCLPPLARWTEGESCANEQAVYDAAGNGPHAGFERDICSPGGRGQNECPGWSSTHDVLGSCLQSMWDEGPGEPFEKHGHYLNMSDGDYSRVACGFATDADGARWSVQNFR